MMWLGRVWAGVGQSRAEQSRVGDDDAYACPVLAAGPQFLRVPPQ